MNALPQDNMMISASEIAGMVGLNENSIQTGMREGSIPCVKVRNKRLMTQKQYVQWVKSLELAAKPAKAKAKPKPDPVTLEEKIDAAVEEADTVAEKEGWAVSEEQVIDIESKVTADHILTESDEIQAAFDADALSFIAEAALPTTDPF